MSYPCCGQNTFLFEPISSKSGCRYKDHEVKVCHTNDAVVNANKDSQGSLGSSDVFNQLLSVVGLVCEDKVPTQDESSYSLEIMMKTELSRLNKYVSVITKEDGNNKRDKNKLAEIFFSGRTLDEPNQRPISVEKKQNFEK